MKKIVALLFSSCILLALLVSGCIVVKEDRGLHKGHYKQPHKVKKYK